MVDISCAASWCNRKRAIKVVGELSLSKDVGREQLSENHVCVYKRLGEGGIINIQQERFFNDLVASS